MHAVVLILGLTSATGAELSDVELLRRAETAFHAGTSGETVEFRRAAELYEELARRGCHNAGLFRNLGNAYFLADDLPNAILAYRRGLRLSPGDPALHAALAEARQRVQYPTTDTFGRPTARTWLPGLPRPTLAQLLALTGLFYLLAGLALTRWFMLRQRRAWVLSWALFVPGLLFAGAAILDIRQQQFEIEYPVVVIARDDVFLRKGNGPIYPKRFEQPLNQGVEARRLFERGDWLQIQLTGGEVGWVPSRSIVTDAEMSDTGS